MAPKPAWSKFGSCWEPNQDCWRCQCPSGPFWGHGGCFSPIDSTQLVSWLPAVCSEAKSTRVICMEKFFLFQNLAFHGILSISIFWPSYIGLDLWPFGLGLWPWPSLLPLATHGDPNNDVGDHLDHFLDMVGAGGCWWVMVGVLVWPNPSAPALLEPPSPITP